MRLKEDEKKILMQLRIDGRKNISKISKELNMPTTTAYDKIRKLEKKVFKRYVPLIDFPTMGLHTHVLICIRCKKSDQERLLNFLLAHENLNSLHRTEYSFEFLAELIFHDIRESLEFQEKLYHSFEGLEYQTFNLVDEIRKEEAFTSSRQLSLLG